MPHVEGRRKRQACGDELPFQVRWLPSHLKVRQAQHVGQGAWEHALLYDLLNALKNGLLQSLHATALKTWYGKLGPG